MTATVSPEAPAARPAATEDRRSAVGLFGARFAVIGVWIAMILLYSALQPERFPSEVGQVHLEHQARLGGA